MTIPVYCINLKERPDRKATALSQFHKHNINNVLFPKFTKDSRGGVYGCYASHTSVWRDFFHKYPDNNYCIVFEDDFVMDENCLQYIRQANKMMSKHYMSIDIINLHNLFVPTNNQLNNRYFSNGTGVTCVAYLISRPYIAKLLNNRCLTPTGRHIDVELNLNKYSNIYSNQIFYCNRKCVYQNDSRSDNHLNLVDSIVHFDRNQMSLFCCELIILIRKYNLNDKLIIPFLTNTFTS